MGSNKRSGANFERLVVSKLRRSGIFAMRAYASDGRSLGHHPGVDIVATGGSGWRLQCKHRRRLPDYVWLDGNSEVWAINKNKMADYLKPDDECADAQIVGDRRGQLVLMSQKKFIELKAALVGTEVSLEAEGDHIMAITMDRFIECLRALPGDAVDEEIRRLMEIQETYKGIYT